MSVKKMTVLSLYTAVALILFVVESAIPMPVPLPFVKLGLANIITLIVRPDVIINCAGCTNPAFCEENVEEAYKVNAVGVRNIAQEAESIHAKLIQLSTDDMDRQI